MITLTTLFNLILPATPLPPPPHGKILVFVSNKRQKGWTNTAGIFCDNPRDPREGLWMD